MIFVAGPPSSGTSCVAGVLERLGVCMGHCPRAGGVRGYATYEDTQTDSFKVNDTGAGPPLLLAAQRLRIREYVEMRMAGTTGPQGFKGAATWWLDDPDPKTLPLRVVLVTRPLEHSIRSDLRYQAKINRERPKGRPVIDRAYRLARAGVVAQAHQAARELHVLLGVATVNFYSLLREPTLGIRYLARHLDLEPTPEQAREAWAFVDPGMRNV